MPNYKIVDADRLDADLGTVAQAIRTKGGTSESLAFPGGFVSAVENMETGGGGGGGGYTADQIASREIAGAISLTTEKVMPYTFYYYNEATSLNAPNVTSIGTYAFYYASKMADVYLPKCETIGEYALTEMLVTELSLPACTEISAYALSPLRNLTRIVLPECTTLGGRALKSCKALEYVDLPKCKSISISTMESCTALSTLILRSATLCSCRSNPLAGTAIANGNGYIYVPSALLETYKSNQYWSARAAQFRALEDYTVDGTITGALDESKI